MSRQDFNRKNELVETLDKLFSNSYFLHLMFNVNLMLNSSSIPYCLYAFQLHLASYCCSIATGHQTVEVPDAV